VCDERGLPLGFSLTAGQINECQVFESLLSGVRAQGVLESPQHLAADRGYSSWTILRWLRRRQITPVIPPKSDQTAPRYRRRLSKPLYRKRNIIERLVGWLKQRRRLATRFEKLAGAFASMIRLAFLEIYLKVLL
jgi:transposase